MGKIEVVPPDPGWRRAFEAEAKSIAAVLGRNVAAIHHIGSTAIPGIYAKPAIDMLLEVRDIAELDAMAAAMKALDYEGLGEFGIPGRRYFRKDDPAGKRTHQVHAFAAGTPQVVRHLAFRDYLIAHPADAAHYSELKRRLAQDHADDPEAYMDGKDGFIQEIDAKAARWRDTRRSG